MKLKVGDRVTTKFGETGTVIDVERLRGSVAVEMDDPHSGVFTLAFPGKSVLWLSEEAWKKIEQKSKILIASDGHTATARLYDGKKVVKSATAKCNPSDRFDFGTGAKLAFDRLMGTEKPKEAKPEPIKLYCVKSYEPGEWCTKGMVYEVCADGGLVHDDGWKDPDFIFFMKRGGVIDGNGTEWSRFLFPLVSRPAKVGEWVYIHNAEPLGSQSYKNGDVFKCSKSAVVCIGDIFVDGKRNLIDAYEYFVIDGYDGRYEEQEKPKGWSGKVVCVNDGHDLALTAGKVYAVKDGVMFWDSGKPMNHEFNSVDDINYFFKHETDTTHAQFIEFKGECDAK